MSYLRSVYLQKDKSIFKLEELPVEKFAESLGLPGVPKIKFLGKEIAKRKNAAMAAQAEVVESEEEAVSSGGDEEDGESSIEDEDVNPSIPVQESQPIKV